MLKRFGLISALVLLLAGILPAVASATDSATDYAPVGSNVYQVTITGTASGNAFSRTGLVVMSRTITRTTTNGVNALDVWLTSGSPITSPQRGAITFASNNYYIGSRSLVDLAFVTWNAATQTVTVRPDANTAAIGANVFNSSSGVLGSLYQIYGGQMQLRLTNGGTRVSGTIDVIAKGAYYYTQVRYQATITGIYIGTA
jgi:hypothetical protein